MAADPDWPIWTTQLSAAGQSLRTCQVMRDLWAASAEADAHQHPVPTLVVPLTGPARVRSRLGTVDLVPGGALLIAAGTWHAHAPLRPGAVCFHLGFKERWCDIAMQVGGRRHERHLDATVLRRGIDQLLLVGPERRVAGLGRLLTRVAAAEAVACPTYSAPHPAVARMTVFLWRNYRRPITADDILRASRLGRSRASALFAAAYGRGPAAELQRLRLQTARSLLAGGLPVAVAAERCGYADRRRFTRACRRELGQAPRALIKEME